MKIEFKGIQKQNDGKYTWKQQTNIGSFQGSVRLEEGRIIIGTSNQKLTKILKQAFKEFENGKN